MKDLTLVRSLFFVCFGVAALLFFPLSAPAADSESIESQQRNYESHLAAVKSIQTALSKYSDKPGVGETLNKAEISIRDAAETASRKDYTAASAKLNDSNTLLKTTLVRLLNSPGQAGTASAALSANKDPASLNGPTREHVERDLEYTRSLIHALRRNPGIKAENIVQIEKNIQTTITLLDAGKNLDADLLIDTSYAQAKGLLVRLEKSPQDQSGSAALDTATLSSNLAVDTKELRNQYTRREESVLSLRSACEQLVKEQPQHQAIMTDSGAMLTEANYQAKLGQYPNAIATLDRIYILLKVGIGAMRGGQQVTASKNFSDPADEYRYEQGRNDDYSQLIIGLIERTPRADWTAMANVAKSRRNSADAAAKSGDWPSALQQIDSSTIEHKKILRSAGFSIM